MKTSYKVRLRDALAFSPGFRWFMTLLGVLAIVVVSGINHRSGLVELTSAACILGMNCLVRGTADSYLLEELKRLKREARSFAVQNRDWCSFSVFQFEAERALILSFRYLPFTPEVRDLHVELARSLIGLKRRLDLSPGSVDAGLIRE